MIMLPFHALIAFFSTGLEIESQNIINLRHYLVLDTSICLILKKKIEKKKEKPSLVL